MVVGANAMLKSYQRTSVWTCDCDWNSLKDQQILTCKQPYDGHLSNISQQLILGTENHFKLTTLDSSCFNTQCCCFFFFCQRVNEELHFRLWEFSRLLLASFDIVVKILGWDNAYWHHLAVVAITLHLLTWATGIECWIKCCQCFVQVSSSQRRVYKWWCNVQCDSAELEQTCMWMIGDRQ